MWRRRLPFFVRGLISRRMMYARTSLDLNIFL